MAEMRERIEEKQREQDIESIENEVANYREKLAEELAESFNQRVDDAIKDELERLADDNGVTLGPVQVTVVYEDSLPRIDESPPREP